MIINIRGTSGSGKTTVMRRVVEELGGFDSFQPHYMSGKRSPTHYTKDNVAVLGSYTNLCGGVDRVQAMGGYALFQQLVGECNGHTLLMEGLLLSEDVKQVSLIPDFAKRARVLFLTTEPEQCIAWVNKRRESHNRTRPLDTGILTGRMRTIERARTKLLALGVDCRRCSARQAPGIILRWIKEATDAGRTNIHERAAC